MEFQLDEVMTSIKQHKTRNALTGFGIAWGIFILIILLGTGEGFHESISNQFNDFIKKTIVIYGGKTSKSEVGKSSEKYILFDEDILNSIKVRFKNDIRSISPEYSYRGRAIASYKTKSIGCNVKGINEDYLPIKALKISKGRDISMLDCEKRNKVAVIGKKIADVLFPNSNPIGKTIFFSDESLFIIGVIEESTTNSNFNDTNTILIPYQTMRDYFRQGEKFGALMLNLYDDVDTENFKDNIKFYLSNQLNFDSADNKAISFIDFEKRINSFNKLFDGIKTFVWFIAICILLTGMVGVSNIMLVIVKERTKEIGIRKALGANKKSIISLILTESILITLISGLVGVFLGFLILLISNIILQNQTFNDELIINKLNFNFFASLMAMLILILAGCIAGLIPAIKASKIHPIEAIRHE